MPAGQRHKRSRQPGARIPEGAVYVGRGPGRVGRFGNPFKVGGAAATALAAHYGLDSWKARQWAAAKLYAHWIGDALAALPEPVANAVRAELKADGDPTPPTLELIRKELTFSFDRGRDVCCWCEPFVDCHGDILRAVAIGYDPVVASGTNPHWADTFRCIEEQRTRKRGEIRDNSRRRGYVKGWTMW